MRGQYYNVGALDLPWPLSFAKEPGSDLDLAIEEPGAAHSRPSPFGSPTPQKPPRLRILVLILLLLVVAGGAYFAMDPEMVMKLTGQEQPMPATATPPVTAARPPISQAPSALPRPMNPERLDSANPSKTCPTFRNRSGGCLLRRMTSHRNIMFACRRRSRNTVTAASRRPSICLPQPRSRMLRRHFDWPTSSGAKASRSSDRAVGRNR